MRRRLILGVVGVAFVLGCQAQKATSSVQESDVLAIVNGEVLREGDFERSSTWLPGFARQLESNATIEVTRFWALVQLMVIAQDAQNKGVLSEAERSLAIKEALARQNLSQLPYPNFVIRPEEIAAWQAAHDDMLWDSEAYTVSYALVKTPEQVHALGVAHGLARGAQMGYNFVDPEPLPKATVRLGVLAKNELGHSMSATKFNYIFASKVNENQDIHSQIGPFTAHDGVLFSCPEAMNELATAPLGVPLWRSIACSGDWQAFVIPEWRRARQRVSQERAQQIALEQLTSEKRAAFAQDYLNQLLARKAQP